MPCAVPRLVGREHRGRRRRRRSTAVEPNGMIDQLERLARLRESGALTDQEYDDAKMAIIGAASRGELG